MPTVDIWGVLNGVKNVLAYVWDSKVVLVALVAAFVVGVVASFSAFWTGLVLPTIDIADTILEVDELNSSLVDIFCYCLHVDYIVAFYNSCVTLINVLVPFVGGLMFTMMVFRYTIFLKNSIGTDIRNAS